MKTKTILFFTTIILSVFSFNYAEELPLPAYSNSIIITIEHDVRDSAEVDYIKANFNFGLYAWLSFSRTSLSPSLDWHADLNRATQNIQDFKENIESLLTAAKEKGVKLHFVLTSGLARPQNNLGYLEAKEEDIRNCQWYNDNNLATESQLADPDSMKKFIWGTFSRYARKMRANLDAKTKATLRFLKQKMNEDPDTLIAISGWGEAELNFWRKDDGLTQNQEWFCDYSPFAVLEFRDWIQHAGLYDDKTGPFKGQGYNEGGLLYQGPSGLSQFNQNYGTQFTTWNLKYYNWSLNDDYDSNPTDQINNDPNKIPFSSFSYGKMMPTSGENHINGGFDPPREMPLRELPPTDKFWELWNLFRETLVHNHVKAAAQLAAEAGIPADQWYTHSIPGDYMFGINPGMDSMNGRYFSSASPLWTANVQPYGSVGATIFDVKFPPDFPWVPDSTRPYARTTQYVLDAISELSPNWAIMEYDAETYPPGFDVKQSPAEDILSEHMKIYNHNVHLINFWRWWDESGEHRIKGKNKEAALSSFISRVRDKARNKDLSIVFSPPKVNGFSGQFVQGSLQININKNIWDGHSWEWKDWGDFDHFAVFRGDQPEFPADEAHLKGTTPLYTYEDRTAESGKTYFYKLQAVNSEGGGGPISDEIRLPGYILNLVSGNGGTTNPKPDSFFYTPQTELTVTALPESSYYFSGWSGDASGITNPLALIMDSNKFLSANFKKINVFPPLGFAGQRPEGRSSGQNRNTILLSWKANPINKDIIKYKIYSIKGGRKTFLAELDPDVFEYVKPKLSRNKSYEFAVTAIGKDNVESLFATAEVPSDTLGSLGILVEIKNGYFQPTEDKFENIYGKGFIIGAEASKSIWKKLDLWVGGSYYTKKGELTFTKDETIVKIFPIGGGVKYRFLTGTLNAYAGMGFKYFLFSESNFIGDVSTAKMGYEGKIGGFLKLGSGIVIDTYLEYSYCKISPTSVEINIGGLNIGVGLGYWF